MILRQGEIQPIRVGVWCDFFSSAHSCCPVELGISPNPSAARAPRAGPGTLQTPGPSSRCCTCLPPSSAPRGSTSPRPYAGNSAAWRRQRSRVYNYPAETFHLIGHIDHLTSYSQLRKLVWKNVRCEMLYSCTAHITQINLLIPFHINARVQAAKCFKLRVYLKKLFSPIVK